MKMFKVQAVCADTRLWEVMRCLEATKCVGIMAQPITNGEDATETPTNGEANLREGSLLDTALQIVRGARAPIKASEVGKLLSAQIGKPVKPHGVLHTLKKRKLIRSNVSGRYVATNRQEAA